MHEPQVIRERTAALMQQVSDNVGAYGVHITYVGSGEDGPSFAYTTGLNALVGHEIIVYALPMAYAHHALNHIHKWLADGTGNNLDENRPYTEFFNHPVKFRQCLPELVADKVTVSTRYYGSQPSVVQLVLCDMNGLFPEDEGFDHEFMDPRQPLLYTEEQ